MNCPKCGSDRFSVKTTVEQEWIVDGDWNWVETLEDYTDLIEQERTGTCLNCGIEVYEDGEAVDWSPEDDEEN